MNERIKIEFADETSPQDTFTTSHEGHELTNLACLVYHSDHHACHKCSCGEWIPGHEKRGKETCK
jgi:hypothetical protein